MRPKPLGCFLEYFEVIAKTQLQSHHIICSVMHDTYPTKSRGYEETYHQEKKGACNLHVGKDIDEQCTYHYLKNIFP